MNNGVEKKRKIPKFLTFVIVCFLGGAALYGYLRYNKATVDKLPPLQNGDLVFQTQRSSQDVAIMYATGSLYSHMGIVKIPPDGEPHVIEAVGPVREITLFTLDTSGSSGATDDKTYQKLESHYWRQNDFSSCEIFRQTL